jgi:hypothetical protein
MALDLIDAAMAAAGTVVGAIGTMFTQRKKDKRDDFAELLRGHNELLEKLKQLYTETKSREDKCEESLAILKQEMLALQAEIHQLKIRMQ